ncbi:hypothetical protein ACQPZG_00600 (plasmid) [Streptomyces sp. CA-294286]|uniref:hypothetical protein n=1 Tax=Streptomyces sp. CA-294286 TaxID=3240070 RepID=UPI003D8AF4C4
MGGPGPEACRRGLLPAEHLLDVGCARVRWWLGLQARTQGGGGWLCAGAVVGRSSGPYARKRAGGSWAMTSWCAMTTVRPFWSAAGQRQLSTAFVT